MKTVDVGALLDDGQWGGYQKLLVFATALTIILDGFDSQVFGAAIPALMNEWTLPSASFAIVLTSSMVGMMFGGAIGGLVGDKFGRRVALLGSVVVFGVLTILVSFSNSITMLVVLRFLSGLGLGGAMPTAAAISSEYVPRRQRPFAVTLTIVCVPLGGSLAGLIGGWFLPRFGWRALFLVGGILPLILAAVLLKVLPESPRYMARLRERWPDLRVLLRRLGHTVPDEAAFVDSTEKAVVRTSVRELLVPEYRRDTLVLCASFLFCLFGAYLGTNWVPAMLRNARFDVGTASFGLLAWNLGGVVFALLGAVVIMRLGSRLAMLMLAAGGVAGCVLLATMDIGPQSTMAVFAMLAITGGFINSTQTTMYALAAHVFPTSIRATGVGTAVAFGRIGGVLSPIIGGPVLGAGASPYFMLIAATMTATFGMLTAVKQHIPRLSRVYAARGAVAQPAGH
jgi:AAHS family 4-hydroxybenzoate transporter-like MFS transporter